LPKKGWPTEESNSSTGEGEDLDDFSQRANKGAAPPPTPERPPAEKIQGQRGKKRGDEGFDNDWLTKEKNVRPGPVRMVA